MFQSGRVRFVIAACAIVGVSALPLLPVLHVHGEHSSAQTVVHRHTIIGQTSLPDLSWDHGDDGDHAGVRVLDPFFDAGRHSTISQPFVSSDVVAILSGGPFLQRHEGDYSRLDHGPPRALLSSRAPPLAI